MYLQPELLGKLWGNNWTLTFYAFLSVNINELLMSGFWYKTQAVISECSSVGNTIEM